MLTESLLYRWGTEISAFSELIAVLN